MIGFTKIQSIDCDLNTVEPQDYAAEIQFSRDCYRRFKNESASQLKNSNIPAIELFEDRLREEIGEKLAKIRYLKFV